MSEEKDEKINNPGKLLKLIEDKEIKNLLLGNGFGLSHPTLKECFEWDMHAAFCSNWDTILPKKSSECPETDLYQIRVNALDKILTYYIDGLTKKLINKNEEPIKSLNRLYGLYKNKRKYNTEKFLSKFDRIFTLNYDPLMYFEFLKLLEDEKLKHQDGFKGERFIKQKTIIQKLKDSEHFFVHLHGSWFIQNNQENNHLKKLNFRSNSEKSWTLEDLFNNNNSSPYIILEDRWRVKEAIINSDSNPYLKFCYEQIKEKIENLLVFGVSFKNDDHILKAICSNPNLHEIFITYRYKKERVEIKQKISQVYSEDCLEKFTFVKLNLDNCIWVNSIDNLINSKD